MPHLVPGAPAPHLSLPLVTGETFTLADQKPDVLTMLVVYRGYHCPICRDFLADQLAPRATAFREAGARLVVLSMDGKERAAKAREEWGLLDLPVAYGLTEADARAWGLYLSRAIKDTEAEIFAEPGTFWVKPDGTLYLVDIANMPFARPNLDILLARVAAVKNGYPPRGTYMQAETG